MTHTNAANRIRANREKRPAPPYDPTASIVRPRHIQHATGLHIATVWRLRRKGKFPEPIKLSEQAVGWRRSDIDAWLAARAGGEQ